MKCLNLILKLSFGFIVLGGFTAHAERICGRLVKTRSDWASRGVRFLYESETDKEFFFSRETKYDSKEDHRLLISMTGKRKTVCVTGRYLRQSGGNNTRYDFDSVHRVEVQ